jgi:LysM domain-containing protein
MGSLTRHLLEPGDHGRLPFHPSCPVCRQERLLGTLSQEPVVSRRTQAVLASGVLAFSAGAPGFAGAAVPDRQAEGIAAPEDPAVGEIDDPAFDPGGETSLPFETAPAPSETADEDDGAGAPIDAEPVDDPDGRLAPLGAEGGAPTVDDASPLPEDVPPATEDGASDVTGTPIPPATVPPAVGEVTGPDPPSAPPARGTERRESGNRAKRDRRSRQERPDAQVPQQETAVTQAPAPPPEAVDANPTVPATHTASASQTVAVAGSERGSSLRDARVYVVQQGDSLWSIAKRLLGADASPARIAWEVDRLWSLNRERIATGDPDLLHVGTELRLRQAATG